MYDYPDGEKEQEVADPELMDNEGIEFDDSDDDGIFVDDDIEEEPSTSLS